MRIISLVRRGCRQGEGEEKEQAGCHRLLSPWHDWENKKEAVAISLRGLSRRNSLE
jgi:hypothetical protein